MASGSPPSAYARAAVRVAMLLVVSCSPANPLNARDAADASDMGRTVSAQSDTERKVLAEAANLPSGIARQIGDASVSAEPPYAAASGRTCRALVLTTAKTSRRRLACAGQPSWFFVPDVFASTGDGAE